MDPRGMFSAKAEKYARYRWDYAPEAVSFLVQMAGLSHRSIVADIGAGTGKLSLHFAGLVRCVYVIEPNQEMRALAAALLKGHACKIMGNTAENTSLRSRSVDLITAAHALQWFDPENARREFRRIIKPTGWLAFVRNYGTDSRLNEAIGELSREEYGVDLHNLAELPHKKPASYFFGNHFYRKLTFPFSFKQDWESFLGGLTSASYMPDENHPLFPKLEKAAREVFERFCANGQLLIKGDTKLIVGRPG
jgi:ubiquinone/menaquinone biosynthesis C-methylase UbiE